MKLTILGATGATGTCLISQALAAGHEVTAVVRDPARLTGPDHPRLRTVTAEYATGMIRTTFSAMPARRLVLVAKAATVAAFVLPVALLIDIVGFELGQRIFASKHIQVALSHPGV